MAVTRTDLLAAGAVLCRVLDAVDRGELEATALQQAHLSGAMAAVDALAGVTSGG